MTLHAEEAVGTSVVGGEQVGQRREVLERLAHLLCSHHHPTRMRPVVGEHLAVGHGLGSLVLVVGELEVLSPGVEVEPFAEEVEAHHHALSVPTRTASTEGGVPARLTVLSVLPQHEIEWTAFLIDGHNASPSPELVERLASQQAVVANRAHVEVDPVARPVRHTSVHEAPNQRHHFFNVGRGMGNLSWSQHRECIERLEPALLELSGDLGFAPTFLGCPVDDVVVDIGDVGDEADVVAGCQQHPPSDVPHQHVASVAEVGEVVDCGSADVH